MGAPYITAVGKRRPLLSESPPLHELLVCLSCTCAQSSTALTRAITSHNATALPHTTTPYNSTALSGATATDSSTAFELIAALELEESRGGANLPRKSQLMPFPEVEDTARRACCTLHGHLIVFLLPGAIKLGP